MFIKIPKLLSDENLSLINEIVDSGNFVDGSGTTGNATKSIKNNLQMDLAAHPRKDEFMQVTTQSLQNHPVVRATALPKAITVPLVSEYQQGMSYGKHVDNSLMNGITGPIRTDIACTIFLSSPSDYEGGELLVKGNSGDARVKLEKGDAFLYPATSRHEVTEITQGSRRAIVIWIQSVIADQAKREIIYDLELAYDRVTRENASSEALQMIQRVQANLIRQWAEV